MGDRRLAPPLLEPGGRFGDYDLLDEIARGGMGVVFKARQRSLNRVVALKMILSGQLASSEEISRFIVEAEAAANLDHPGIVPVYEIGDVAGQHYFSMGFVDGDTLSTRIKDKPLAPRRAAEMAVAIAEAVAYAHQQGVIHRDLKPGNVLIDTDGRPRITDFGLAKRVTGDSQLTVTGQVLGTPSYMAPEQAQGDVESVGTAADVYAIGAILYALLTTRPPFQASSLAETLRMVVEVDPVAPSALQPGVPRDLETICLKCLKKSPQGRYASATEVALDLKRFLAGEPIVARPVRWPERTWRWCTRNKAVATLLVGLALTLIAGATASTVFGIRARVEEAAARQREYDARSLLLQSTWNEGSIGRVNDLLEAQKPPPGATDLRGFEWYYWRNTLDRGHRRLAHFDTTARSVAWSPDGRLLAIGLGAGVPGKLVILDVERGETVLERDFPARVDAVAWSPDGHLVAAGIQARDATDPVVTLVDSRSGEVARVLACPHGVQKVAFSPDSTRLAVATGSMDGEGGTTAVFHLATGDLVFEHAVERKTVWAVSWSTDGALLAASDGFYDREGAVTLFDGASGRVLREIPAGAPFAFDVAIDPSGERVAAAVGVWNGGAGKVNLWETGTGRQLPIQLQGHEDRLVAVEWSPDGERLATGDFDTTVRVWDAGTGKELHNLRAHTAGVMDVAFDPTGQRIASSAGANSGSGEVELWQAATGQRTALLPATGFLGRTLRFSPTGDSLVTAGGNDEGPGFIRYWSYPGLEPMRTVSTEEAVGSLAFDASGRVMATVSADRVQIRGPDGEVIEEIEPPWPPGPVGLSPDGNVLGAVGAQTHLRRFWIWDREAGAEIVLPLDERASAGLPFWSPDGSLVAVGELVYQPAGEMPLRLFNWPSPPDWQGRIVFWDLKRRRRVAVLDTGDSLGLGAAWSHDGKRFAIGNIDSTILLWEAGTKAPPQILRGHSGRVHAVAFTPDDRRLVSASADGTVKVWNVATAQEILSLDEHTTFVDSVDVSPDGQFVVSASAAEIALWDGSR